MTAPQPPDTTNRYFSGLDGLRLLCCTWVIVGHCFIGHPDNAYFRAAAAMGVNVFFSLSGFLICSLLLNERERTGGIDLKAFYARRTLRIWPTYFLAIATAFSLFAIFGQDFLRPLGSDIATFEPRRAFWLHILFVANLVPVTLPTALRVLWSICAEEQFYLLFPPLLAWRRSKTPVFLPAGALLLLAGAFRFYLGARGESERIVLNTLSHADHLLFGAILAQLSARSFGRAQRIAQAIPCLDWLSLGAVVTLIIVCRNDPTSGWGWLVNFWGSALATTSLVFAVAFSSGSLSALFARPPVRYLGQLTYAAYVFHEYPVAVGWWFALRVTHRIELEAPIRALVACLFTFLLAAAIHRYLEMPLQRLKSSFLR